MSEEATGGDRVIAAKWGEDGTVEGILQPPVMDEPRCVRDDNGNNLYVGRILYRFPTVPKRINVAVNPEELTILQVVIEREGVSLTEAVRRLIGYGEVVYRAVREEGAEVLLKTAESTREVVIL